jgi:ACR3 family arsenite efflux pump ArsB
MGANFPTTFHQVPIERNRPECDHLRLAPHAVCALTTVGLGYVERSVVVIESAVRNVGVALVLARALLSPAELAISASFLIGHFLIELIIMISYATLVQRENAQSDSPAMARDERPG